MEKKYPLAKSGICVYCVGERKKNNRFEIHVIILRYIKKCKSFIQKSFKISRTSY